MGPPAIAESSTHDILSHLEYSYPCCAGLSKPCNNGTYGQIFYSYDDSSGDQVYRQLCLPMPVCGVLTMPSLSWPALLSRSYAA